MDLNRNISYRGVMSNNKKVISILAPAKINLFLKVLGKRPDGYHNIFSWFQAIDLADWLEITTTKRPEITIETDHPDLPTDEKNLVFRAAQLIQKEFCPETGFRVSLQKKIPVAAGLGGGSSDAAAFIKGINKLLGLHMTRHKMEKVGLEIGSDVPFFFSRGQAEITGRGENVKNIAISTDYEIFLVTPSFPVSAKEAYQKVRLDLTSPFSNISLSYCQLASKLFGVISDTTNDLERALLDSCSVLARIKDKLTKTGADIVRLSGSGPTLFALYRRKGLIEDKLARSFEREGWFYRITKPVILPSND
jgi:4-diphosphocytidyl-2-C-methyl-D-erythritol kinase